MKRLALAVLTAAVLTITSLSTAYIFVAQGQEQAAAVQAAASRTNAEREASEVPAPVRAYVQAVTAFDADAYWASFDTSTQQGYEFYAEYMLGIVPEYETNADGTNKLDDQGNPIVKTPAALIAMRDSFQQAKDEGRSMTFRYVETFTNKDSDGATVPTSLYIATFQVPGKDVETTYYAITANPADGYRVMDVQ